MLDTAATQITGAREGITRFPRYDNAVLGFAEYWYPVMFSRTLGHRPLPVRLFGADFVFIRDRGTAFALADRCPHRGIPLSAGSQIFPGTISCRYHAWTFDLKTGVLAAALTDGPESPVCGKSRVAVYPVAERAGIIWMFRGEGPPPPLESHIPSEMLSSEAVVEGRITDRPGDWRYAAENGFDDGHSKSLHRDALFLLFRKLPAWSMSDIIAEDAGWVTRKLRHAEMQASYPGLGVWPRFPFWKSAKRGAVVSIRLPGVLRVNYREWVHFEWYVPIDAGRHRYLQFAVKRASGLAALGFRFKYRALLSWIFHRAFNSQDAAMVELMKTPPEQLFRPDNSLIGWRKLCEQYGGIDTALLRSSDTPSTVLPQEMELSR